MNQWLMDFKGRRKPINDMQVGMGQSVSMISLNSSGPFASDRFAVKIGRSALGRLGCDVETLPSHGLLAVNVLENALLGDVQLYLRSIAGDSVIDYEGPILRQ